MQLNTIKSSKGTKRNKLRVGRGIGSGHGKTCGRGHKGQKSRSGGFHKVGFEGGQMPIQRRLPKKGFISHTAKDSISLKLSDLMNLDGNEIIDLSLLKSKKIISHKIRRVKIYNPSDNVKKINFINIFASKSVKNQIENNGGALKFREEAN
ncbi:50S ribosomal protein L15 [Nitrosomonas sp.]|uniref:50S ribosomal protein L15 n=1 Tax=Nitrosomonas sp. TaxID=42353 RepID=UPI001DFD6934|nr:50S ribosomal protein L15 [Nitrosomonas sp.]MBX3616432.1 50S ribosomal protein L15 [Nitrosomonas sp.]